MAVLAFLRRSPTSLESHGQNVKVFLHGSETHKLEAIVHTNSDYLIIYAIVMSSEAVDACYKLLTTVSTASHRRSSFVGSGESDYIMPLSIKYKRMIKVDSRLSW
jgi:hypothetical protein